MKREVFPRRAEVAAGACVAAIMAMAALTISAAAQEQKIGAPPESMNMRLVLRHSDFDRLVWDQGRTGRCSGSTSISMLRATPGCLLIKPARSSVITMW